MGKWLDVVTGHGAHRLAASWEKADFPEGPCDLPADAGGPALADCVT